MAKNLYIFNINQFYQWLIKVDSYIQIPQVQLINTILSLNIEPYQYKFIIDWSNKLILKNTKFELDGMIWAYIIFRSKSILDQPKQL